MTWLICRFAARAGRSGLRRLPCVPFRAGNGGNIHRRGQQVARLAPFSAQRNVGDEVDQFAQHHRVERRPAVFLEQYTLQAVVALLDRQHRLVDQLPDRGLSHICLQMRPARFLRHPEDNLGRVFVQIFGPIRIVCQQFRTLGLEVVRNMFQEYQPSATCL